MELEMRSPARGGVGDLKCFGETDELMRSLYFLLLFNLGDEDAEGMDCMSLRTACTSVSSLTACTADDEEELVHLLAVIVLHCLCPG